MKYQSLLLGYLIKKCFPSIGAIQFGKFHCDRTIPQFQSIWLLQLESKSCCILQDDAETENAETLNKPEGALNENENTENHNLDGYESPDKTRSKKIVLFKKAKTKKEIINQIKKTVHW